MSNIDISAIPTNDLQQLFNMAKKELEKRAIFSKIKICTDMKKLVHIYAKDVGFFVEEMENIFGTHGKCLAFSCYSDLIVINFENNGSVENALRQKDNLLFAIINIIG